MAKTLITKSGKQRLMEELKELKQVKRPQIIERIKIARALGDLSENAEWDEARNQQSFVEGRIREIEAELKNSVVVKNKSISEVAVGSSVKVKLGNEEKLFAIVSPPEVDPVAGKISSESPIGKALMGKKKGDQIDIETPAGKVNCQIIAIK